MAKYYKKVDRVDNCSRCGHRDLQFTRKTIYDSDGDENGFISHHVCKKCGNKHFHEEQRFNEPDRFDTDTKSSSKKSSSTNWLIIIIVIILGVWIFG